MWELILSLLNGDKPGSASQEQTKQGGFTPNMLMRGEQKLTGRTDPASAQQGADLQQSDAFGSLLQSLTSQRNPNQQMRKQQLMQMVAPTDPFLALLGM